MRSLALSLLVAASTAVLGVGGHAAQAAPKQDTKQATASEHITIETGDSLSKIAKKQDSTVKRLFYANKDIKNPNLIYPGDKLRIPADDEELEPRPMPQMTAVAPTKSTPAPQPAVAAATPAPSTAASAPQAEAAPVAKGSVWDRLAQCESGGNWSINTGNGFYGGLQFTPSSWHAVGGSGLPHQASRAEQIKRAKALQAIQGWGAWPACSAQLGLR